MHKSVTGWVRNNKGTYRPGGEEGWRGRGPVAGGHPSWSSGAARAFAHRHDRAASRPQARSRSV